MVKIKGFKGIIYNKEKLSNLDDVMSPPYDIISKELQDELYEKNNYNFVKLILNKIKDTDNEKDNRYTRSKELYLKWLKENVLFKSDEEAIYPYKISYNLNGTKKTMNGFFCLLQLDHEYRFVKAHERTLSKPKADRLNLLRETKSNLEPIQLLYIDDEDIIRKKIDENIDSLISDVKGYDGFNHKLWKITDSNLINMIKDFLDERILFIADGHHRYQTAINYSEEMSNKTGIKDKDAPFNYRLVILANIFDEGLSILPTHRLIKMNNYDLKKNINKLKKYFDIRKIEINKDHDNISKKIMKDIETKDEHKFALYTGNEYYIFTLLDEKAMDEFSSDRSKTWKTLDVSILHKIILEYGFGINQENLEDHIRYTREDEEAIKFVDKNKFDLSFLMNSTKIEELKIIAEAGEHMPQKSTYFLPKMLSGLVIYKMEF